MNWHYLKYLLDRSDLYHCSFIWKLKFYVIVNKFVRNGVDIVVDKDLKEKIVGAKRSGDRLKVIKLV